MCNSIEITTNLLHKNRDPNKNYDIYLKYFFLSLIILYDQVHEDINKDMSNQTS